MMQVTVPTGAAAGQMMQVQLPAGQLVQVRVPAGLQPGQIFHMQVPAAGPVTAEQALAASIAAAGGELHVSNDGRTSSLGVVAPTPVSNGQYTQTILNAAGTVIATIEFRMGGGDYRPANPPASGISAAGSAGISASIVLPDGRIAATLLPKQRPAYGRILLCGSAGDSFGEVEARWAVGPLSLYITRDLRAGDQHVLSFVEPSRPWVWPFVIGTCCLGAACVHCIVSCERRPTFYVLKGKERVGEVKQPLPCSCDGGDDLLPRWSMQRVKSNDPAVLRAWLNYLAAETLHGLLFPDSG